MSGRAEDLLLVFLKAPRPGQVKSRLIPALGADAAAELYRVLAEEVIRRTAPLAGEYRRLFFFTPSDALAEVQAWFPGETLLPQEGTDLGQRMAAAFSQAFRQDARRVAIIGTDAPAVSRERVLEAFGSLDDHDVVIGPARDGGYYLLALSQSRPALFQGLAWSTPSVFASTAERAKALGLGVRVLETLGDIDTLEDVRRDWPPLRPMLAARRELMRLVERALASATG